MKQRYKEIINYIHNSKNEVGQINIGYVFTISLIFLCVVSAYSIVFTITKTNLELVPAYLSFIPVFIISLIAALIYKKKKMNNYSYSLTLTLGFIIGMLGFGAVLSFANKTNPATMFPIIFIISTLLFTYNPKIKLTLLPGLYIIFLIIVFIFKRETFTTDLINGIAVLIATFFINLSILKLKAKEYYSRSKLIQISAIDELTNLPNRRMLNSYLDLNFDIKKHSKMCAMMIDVDDFKKYNDTYGHLEGDTVLKKISNVLRGYGDNEQLFISRFGGEEFVGSTFINDEDYLYDLGKKIQDEISIIKTDNVDKITVSIGIASIDISNKTNYLDCINLADEALYKAKENGKNTIVRYKSE